MKQINFTCDQCGKTAPARDSRGFDGGNVWSGIPLGWARVDFGQLMPVPIGGIRGGVAHVCVDCVPAVETMLKIKDLG